MSDLICGEAHLYDFLAELVAAADEDSILAGCEVHDTAAQKLEGAEKGLRVWDGESDLSPGPGNVMREFDCDTMVVCFAKVGADAPAERKAARDLAVQLAAAVVQAIVADCTLGSRVCDVLRGRVPRNYTNVQSETYAVANVHLLINPSGQRRAQ